MIEIIESWDIDVLLWINSHHSRFLDEFMWVISAKQTWIPLYVFLAIIAWRKQSGKQFWIFLICVACAIAVADLSSVHLFKNMIMRYRPSHNLEIEQYLHFYAIDEENLYKGGQYGFISSHAANFFALTALVLGVLRKLYGAWLTFLMFIISLLTIYSRVYLGVHYPSDVVVGAFWGTGIGMSFTYLYRKINILV